MKHSQREAVQAKKYASTLKSGDTEEYIDLIFYRPIGYRIALLCRYFRFTPNQVTFTSILLGVAGGICFAFLGTIPLVVGICLLIMANLLDSVDGQLARLTNQHSRVGRILDGLAGDCWFVAIYLALAFRLLQEGWEEWGFVLAAIAGFFHIKQAASADYYRNIHLFLLRPVGQSELVSSHEIARENRGISWRREPLKKFLGVIYFHYTRSQESMTSSWRDLAKAIHLCYGNNPPSWVRKVFLEESRPLMKYANILSFNVRVIVLIVSLIFNVVWIYFLFEITLLNLLWFYMVIRHERWCAYVLRLIEDEQLQSYQHLTPHEYKE